MAFPRIDESEMKFFFVFNKTKLDFNYAKLLLS